MHALRSLSVAVTVAVVAVGPVVSGSVAVAQIYPPFVNPIAIPDSLDHLKCYPMRITDPNYPAEDVTADLLNQWQIERRCIIQTPPILFCSETAKIVTDPLGNPIGAQDDQRGARAGDFACYSIMCPRDLITPTRQQDGTSTRKNGELDDQFSVGPRPFEIKRDQPRLVCAPVTKTLPPPPVGFPPNDE